MIKINLLTAGFTSPNGVAFLFPLVKFKNTLKESGIKISFVTFLTEAVTDCDLLLIDSKFFKSHWARDFGCTLEMIACLGEKVKIAWCDQADSTGTLLGQVLPYIDRYLKAQLLRDRREYMKEHYAARIFADYYHEKYGIVDKDPYMKNVVCDTTHLDKLGLSWNSGLMNYGWISPYLMKLRKRIPANIMLQFSSRYVPATTPRPLDASCRMGISYARETICFQRRKIREIMANRLPTDKLSRRQYFHELARSKICLSPFGLGEITLKDFECFLMGSLLLKPDMSHMETWPHFYEKDVTCATHSWDLEDVEQVIEEWLKDESKRLTVAQTGQKRYLEYTVGRHAPELFAAHFKDVLGI